MDDGVLRIEDILAGKSLEELVSSTSKWCDKEIKELDDEFAKRKDKFFKADKRLGKIIFTDVYSLTREEKLYLYENFINKMRSIRSNYVAEKFNEFASDRLMYYQTVLLTDDKLRWYHIYMKKLNEYKKANRISVAIDKKMFFQNMEQTKSVCLKLFEMGFLPQLILDQDMKEQDNNDQANYLYTDEEFISLHKFEHDVAFNDAFDEDKKIFTSGFKICFLELERMDDPLRQVWTLSDVYAANSKIDILVKEIKNNNYSPYEAMLRIQDYVTRIGYAEDPNDYNDADCTIMGIKNNHLLCAGYSSLTKAIIDKLNWPELKCTIVGCKLYEKKGGIYKLCSGHAQCMIEIVDRKYDIKGHYMNDACWSVDGYKLFHGSHYSTFLFPITDLMCLKGQKYMQSDTEKSRFEALKWSLEYESEKSLIKRRIKYLNNYRKVVKKNYVPDIVKKFGKDSPVIPIQKLFNGLMQIFAYKYPDKSHNELIEFVEDKLTNDSVVASKIFDKGATNQLVEMGRKLENAREQYKNKNKSDLVL